MDTYCCMTWEFATHKFAVACQESFGRHDGYDLLKGASTQFFGTHCKSTALVIGENEVDGLRFVPEECGSPRLDIRWLAADAH
jgi:hypothetical protein